MGWDIFHYMWRTRVKHNYNLLMPGSLWLLAGELVAISELLKKKTTEYDFFFFVEFGASI